MRVDVRKIRVRSPKRRRSLKRRRGKKKTPKPSAHQEKPASNNSACLYKPGEFREIRLKFIADLRKSEDVTWPEACRRWKTSERRAKLLEGMSHGQLKKRRFI